ncbi:MAG: polysaccharide pyruvyl transferase family protein [Bacteroidales bacterium]|uniref:polysaccharide pyruvyl transferase family protein n=1 Tax=Porphyromonas sp. TaxID=1924944 RepID=UPI002978DA53|nr:polysaccharide pyruvyl transferase family protein [Porphyromonas sp.]MDD7438337.1 polysaccharide pyruvyl transferase family protein [Bacteroidales bacterium]MDY3066763.1 polysaccharide pyruvyl transferase family protein [Porphyromonas sp.]
MAKVGILTQPLGTNYGGILQAFALQYVLQEMGHEPLTLDRIRPWYFRMASLGWGGLNYILERRPKIRMWPNNEELKIITKHTSKFIEEHISITKPIGSTQGLKRTTKEEGIEAIVVGSDQVWRKAYSPCMSNYFLDFLSDNNQIKKIAYAASFGIDEWEFGKNETEYYKSLARKFDAISVREDSAVTLCRHFLGVEATHVLDPTMLVEKSVYERLASSPITRPSSGNLFCYVLDRTPQKMSLVDKVAEEKSLVPFELLPKKIFGEIKSNRELEDCILPPVEQWLRSFVDADFVVTDSFHGTVFSILFNKPFLTIGNESRGLARFFSLLNSFGLNERVISDDDFVGNNSNDIDWNSVSERLNGMRASSKYILSFI